VLLVLPPKSHRVGEIKEHEYRHLVLVLDVSRSMQVEDAGPTGKQKRADRAADLIQSFFERVQAERYKTTVIAVASDAKPVVLDTTDREVVRNILTELPMRHAFKAGETNLFSGLEAAAKIARPWAPGSAVVMVVTDGDTVPATGMPKMPVSVGGNVVLVGVGNPTVGTSLGGHSTRQDVSTLRQVANRLNGTYHDGNEKHLTTDLVSRIDERARPKEAERWSAREYALLCVGAGTGALALLPVVLALVGTGWTPGRRRFQASGAA
jgi:Ca-activated chloride channel family protein